MTLLSPTTLTTNSKRRYLPLPNIHWAEEKIRKGEYELWADVLNYKQLGYETAESLELPDWAYTYFDFEKFGYDIAAEHNGTMTSYGWFVFK